MFVVWFFLDTVAEMKRLLPLTILSLFLVILPIFVAGSGAKAVTFVGSYHTSTSDGLNDIISSNSIYPKGFIYYKSSHPGFAYKNISLKYSLSDNYISSTGGAGNWEYSHGLNYIIHKDTLFLPNSEASGVLGENERLEFRANNPLEVLSKWVKLPLTTQVSSSYIENIKAGYLAYEEESLLKNYPKLIPLVDSKKMLEIKNYGKAKEYFQVKYNDRINTYTVKDGRVVSFKVSGKNVLSYQISMRAAEFSLYTPDAVAIK